MKHSKNHLKRRPLLICVGCLCACASCKSNCLYTVLYIYIVACLLYTEIVKAQKSLNTAVTQQYIYIYPSIHQSDQYMYVSACARRDCHLTNKCQHTTFRITQRATIKCFYSYCNIAYAYNGVTECDAVQHLLAVQTLWKLRKDSLWSVESCIDYMCKLCHKRESRGFDSLWGH
jgi:hypothetical protein